MNNLHELLKDFNWYYTMTDDPRRFDEGLAHENRIFKYLQTNGLEETLEYLDALKKQLTLLYKSKTS